MLSAYRTKLAEAVNSFVIVRLELNSKAIPISPFEMKIAIK